MPKGSIGTQTSTIIHVKKANRIACDCARYWCVKPSQTIKKKKKKKIKK